MAGFSLAASLAPLVELADVLMQRLHFDAPAGHPIDYKPQWGWPVGIAPTSRGLPPGTYRMS
jgi:hypothetical protein